MNRIEELNQSLKDAWSSDQKVKALKIVIQVSFNIFILYRADEFGSGVACPISFLGKEGFLILFYCFILFFTETNLFEFYDF